MAGRGRGATLPAWMTAGGGAPTNGGNGAHDYNSSQPPKGPATNYDDYASYDPQPSADGNSYGAISNTVAPPVAPSLDQRGTRGGSSSRGAKRSRSRSPHRRAREGRGDGFDRGSGRDGREPSNYKWKPRDKSLSNFDVRPPDGVELPPIAVAAAPNGVPNSYYSYINPANPPSMPSNAAMQPQFMQQPTFSFQNAALPTVNNSQTNNLETRHGRRLYVGGLPPQATESEILTFFNGLVSRALGPDNPNSSPVTRMYLNTDKCYAFIEFDNIELATACMVLDGIRFEHSTGTTMLRVRRPNDYRPDTLPPPGPIPRLNLDVLGAAGATMTSGPGKLFIGGLPYSLADEQVLELLGAFGPVKQFHQVRDPGAINSKGYGFCEYENPEHAEQAINGLNGMALGDKTLTVRHAVPSSNTSSSNNNGGIAMQQNQQLMMLQQQLQQQQQMLALSGVAMPNVSLAALGQNPLLSGLSALAPPLAPTIAPPAINTRVLRLSNMVTRDDLADDIECEDIKEDVRIECEGFGRVLQVLIPRGKDGFPAAVEGFIFVQFENAQCAKQASDALNGRKFADKVVVVSYFDEVKFASGILL